MASTVEAVTEQVGKVEKTLGDTASALAEQVGAHRCVQAVHSNLCVYAHVLTHTHIN